MLFAYNFERLFPFLPTGFNTSEARLLEAKKSIRLAWVQGSLYLNNSKVYLKLPCFLTIQQKY